MIFIKRIFTPLLFAALIWLGGYVWFVSSALIMKPDRPNEITDAIIVLTGGQMRIEAGLGLFAKGRAAHLFITGVHPKVSKREIKQKWSGEVALPPCCITLGHKANTTQQNADETRSWLADKDYASIRLITANFHMNRALVEFNHSIPNIEIIPHPIVQPNTTATKLRFWKLSFVEYHKTMFRWVRLLFSKPREVQ